MTVTNHAIDQYIERILNVSREQAERRILNAVIGFKNTVTVDAVTYVIIDDTVVTVYGNRIGVKPLYILYSDKYKKKKNQIKIRNKKQQIYKGM